jgi:hypothetical protein
MTTEERAQEILEMIETWRKGPHGKDVLKDDLEIVIEAIKAEEREACAMIAAEMKVELSQRPEKLQYGRTQIEVAEYIAETIRARSNS